MSERTKGTAELFKVNEAVLILVYEAENPKGEGALDGAEGPRLQQREERAELLEAQLVLLQIGQAGVMMEQRWALYLPVAAEEMLPLKKEIKKTTKFFLQLCASMMKRWINCIVSVTHFEQVIELIKLRSAESDFLRHHSNLKTVYFL